VIKRALARGVKLVNGSDLGSLPFAVSPASEIAVLVELGVPAPQALRAATSTAGTLLDPLCGPDQADCERGRLGVIAPKAFADMIAVTGDPTKDIKTLETLRCVMKGGVVYKQ
jgi:imidazolonepropionase-like amidohydrolase